MGDAYRDETAVTQRGEGQDGTAIEGPGDESREHRTARGE
jgi:hypothetical protein